MKKVVLRTKIYAPPARKQLVPRLRLLAALNANLGSDDDPGRKLTLISAPAGFGKTTLLSQWLAILGEKQELHIAWLSLDSADNDPARFFTCLIAAIQVQAPEVGAGTQALIQSPLPPVGLILSTLINEVVASDAQTTVGDPRLLLVLDDYHLITATAVHEAMSFLLEHLPPNWHVIISSRHDPPFPVARLRGQNQMTEIRQSDLRFTRREATVFLQEVMSLPLSGGDAGKLAMRTEGWASGLQIAALALQGTLASLHADLPEGFTDTAESPPLPAVTAFVEAFSGSHRYVLDYLLEEVLQHQPDDVQRFLMQTAILERLSAPLCAAIVQWPADQGGSPQANSEPRNGDSRAHQMLEYLESNNLFIIPLDNERRWYRYHHLFAELLQLRLFQTEPNLIPLLNQRACAWFEAAGYSGEAITHALAAGDAQLAIKLLEKAVEPAMMRGEVLTVRKWIEALPDGILPAHPRLALLQAWAMFMTGGPVETVCALLNSVDQHEGTVGWSAPVRAYLAYFQGDSQQANCLARQALQQLPQEEHLMRGLANLIRGVTAQATGDVIPATEALKAAGAEQAGTEDVMMATLAMCLRAQITARQGDLHHAWDLYQQALLAARDEAGRPRPIASEPLFGLAQVALQWNELEQAAAFLEEGLVLAGQWSEFAPLDGYLIQARLFQARGDFAGGQRVLAEAARLAERFDVTELDDRAVALYQAEMAISQGNLPAAENWARARGLPEDLERICQVMEMDPIYKYEYLTLAELYLAEGRPDMALTLLELLYELMDRYGVRIRICLLQALAREALGDGEAALKTLAEALALAEPAGFMRIFLDAGENTAQLLYRALAAGIAPDFVGRLLAAFAEEIPAGWKKTPAPQLVEPLSERELEVLVLVAEGLTNQEIADRLFLSLATVKWHTGNIYSKLGVGNRTEAVARATHLGLF